jgi:nitrogen fixation protein FixH
MATILITFFGIVIAVNLIMARYAIGTFGGTVVDNSYVASQKFNDWLDEADRQAKLGLDTRIAIDQSRHIAVSASHNDTQIAGFAATGLAIHPLGRAPAIWLTFEPTPTGTLLSRQVLPPGRWDVRLSLQRNAKTVRLRTHVQ